MRIDTFLDVLNVVTWLAAGLAIAWWTWLLRQPRRLTHESPHRRRRLRQMRFQWAAIFLGVLMLSMMTFRVSGLVYKSLVLLFALALLAKAILLVRTEPGANRTGARDHRGIGGR